MGKMSLAVNARGNLFQTESGFQSRYVGENADFLRFVGSWAMGIENDSRYASINTSTEKECWPGPIDTLTSIAKDPLDWNEVWTVSRSEVEQHVLKFDEPNYEMPMSIKNWPAAHKQLHIWAYLAAFVDWNDNGIYDPENGDYPDFSGDKAIYTISNDQYGEHLASGTEKLIGEQLTELYTLNEFGFENVLFGSTYFINRSDRTYAPFYFGHMLDFQLGDSSDNRIGTNVSENMVIGYNGDELDEGDIGFGTAIPGVALIYLNQDIYSSSILVENDPIRGIPKTGQEFESVMSGLWKTGAQKSMNLLGTESGAKTRYIYPAQSDPENPDIVWTDESSGEGFGTRKMVLTTKHNRLKPSEHLKLDFAIIFETQTEGNVPQSLSVQAQKVKNRYRTTVAVENYTDVSETLFRPNPLKMNGLLNFGREVESVKIWSSQGRLTADISREELRKKKFSFSCNEIVSEGVFIIETKSKDEIRRQKVIVTAE